MAEKPSLKLSRCYVIYAVLLAALVLVQTACEPFKPGLTPSITNASTPTITTTVIPSATYTPTPLPSMAVLLATSEADQALVNSLQTTLNDIVTAAGIRWQVRQQLSPEDINPSLRLVVVVPPNPGLESLVASAPKTQFLALGITDLKSTPNLTVIDTGEGRPDQQGFVAGIIAAMLSADWRAGVISIADTVEGRAARTGFLNGVEYFCGLCRPIHPPFYEYPLNIELPASASSPEWQEAANYMVDHNVTTVYVYPGAGDESMLSILAKAKVNIISSGEPAQAIQSSWVVSLTIDPTLLIQNQVESLLNGSQAGGRSLVAPLQFTHINTKLFTPGKQRLAEQILSDLQNGYIDTGVDLTTGELRP